jgi:hypothetical protein
VYVRANPCERFIPFSFAASIAAELSQLAGAAGVSNATAATLVALNPAISSTFRYVTATNPLESRGVGLALFDLVTAIADEKAVALFLDDLHWSDPASSEAVSVIASRLAGQPVLLVTTVRPRYAIPALPESTEGFSLSRLDETEVRNFVSSLARLPDADWAQTLPKELTEHTGGSPQFLLETLRYCLDKELLRKTNETWDCPDYTVLLQTLREANVMSIRLKSLSSGEKSILLTLSLAGLPLSKEMLASSTGMSGDEIKSCGARLEAGGFVVIQENQFSISHDSVEDAVTRTADAGEVRKTEAELATVMASLDDSAWKRRAVAHFVAAEKWNDAAIAIRWLVKNKKLRAREVTVQLPILLGPRGDDTVVARVRCNLPLSIRRPVVRPFAIGLGVAIFAVGGAALGFHTAPQPKTDNPTVVSEEIDAAGSNTVRVIALDPEHWDANQPLTGEVSKNRRAHIGLRNDYSPRPGTETWAQYVIYPDSGAGEIDLSSLDGKRFRLTNSRGDDRPGSFSPDGRQLAFMTTRWNPDGAWSPALMDMATHRISRLTHPDGTDDQAIWNPSGVQIGFQRTFYDERPMTVCTIHPDGSGEYCAHLGKWIDKAFFGWLDDHHMLIHASDSRENLLLVYDTDSRSYVTRKWSGFDGMQLEPSGRWAMLVNKVHDNVLSLAVAPTSNLDAARPLESHARAKYLEARFLLPELASNFLQKIEINLVNRPLLPGVPYLLTARFSNRLSQPMRVAGVSWRSLTPRIAKVDSLGVVIGQAEGEAIIQATAGGWRSAETTISIRRATVREVMSENWDSTWTQRWRRFGDPYPVIISDNGVRSFLNNGDGNFLSGAYTASSFDPVQGVIADVELSTPIKGLKWQFIHVGIMALDEQRLKTWDHRTGYIDDLRHPYSCSFSVPSGEGVQSLIRLRAEPYPVFDGQWFWLRLQVFPDGRCGYAINGHPMSIVPIGSNAEKLRVLIQGNSVGTKILARNLRVRLGVPSDIDWTKLSFNRGAWQLKRKLRSGHRH